MIEYVKRHLVINSFMYKLLGEIYFYFQFVYLFLFQSFFSIFPIKNDSIIFISYYGKGYGDSGKYIVEQLKNNGVKIFWAYKNKNDKSTLPKYVTPVKFNSLLYLYYLSTSKVLINNTRFLYGSKKRKKQVYIQLWHGGIALKKVEFDSNLPKKYIKTMNWDNKLVDIMISNGSFCSKMYRDSFLFNKKIYEYGTPRNDVLINNFRDYYIDVRKKFEFNINDKILLYAPTFRSNYEYFPYDLDLEKIKKILNTNSKDNWKILVRMHPLALNIDILGKYKDIDLINVSDYPDMQELISSCDILLTDYSSTMFEAMLINKIVLLYANDMEQYCKERGLYFNIDNLPFSVSKNKNEFYDNLIKVLKDNNYINSYKNFINDVGLIEDGNASKKVAKLIVNMLNGENNE